MQEASKFGIYLNAKENQAVRINSPYWIPEGPDWVLVTPEVNATLRARRSNLATTSVALLRLA